MDYKLGKSLLRLFFEIIWLIPLICFAGNLGCQSEKTTASKENAPPVITSVTILPERPNQESELKPDIKSHDPDGEAIHYHYQWVRNDEEIAGENQSTLRNVNFRKGDLIRVKVTPSDEKMDGEPFLSPPVRILNTPPVIQKAWIEPKVPNAADALRINVLSDDADNDFIYYTYLWEKNGIALMEERGEVLEQGRFKRGDRIAVTVVPDDREALGAPKKTEPVTIANGPPIITSSPPTNFEGSVYIYQVKASDPDNDPIRFSLKSGPKGMEMDPNTGLIRWPIHKENRGDHLIEIEASDNAGARSTQRYTLTVDFR